MKAFSPRHKFSKLINRKRVKVSYRDMPNIAARINKYNKNTTKTYRYPALQIYK